MTLRYLCTFSFLFAMLTCAQAQTNEIPVILSRANLIQLLQEDNGLILSAQQQGNQRLDSVDTYRYDANTSSWERSGRQRYLFPAQNTSVSYNDSWSTADAAWKLASRTTSIYDPATFTSDDISQTWDPNTSTWINSGRRIYTEDSQGRWVDLSTFSWDTTQSSWVGFFRILSTYPNQGAKRENIFQSWDANTGTWVNDQKEFFSFNAPAKPASIVFSNWDAITSAWVPDQRFFYNYNAQGIITSELRERYDLATMSWNNNRRITRSLNSQGQTEEVLYENWDNGSWVNSGKDLFTYDANGFQTSFTNQLWAPNLQSWINSSQNLSTWDPVLEERVERAFFFWVNNDWEKNSRSTSQFNPNGTLAEVFRYGKDPNANEWTLSSRSEYFYSDITFISDQLTQLRCALPNPIQQGVAYGCDALDPTTTYTLQVQDLTGRVLHRSSFQGSDSFHLTGNFSEGIYLLSISDGQKWVYRSKVRIE